MMVKYATIMMDMNEFRRADDSEMLSPVQRALRAEVFEVTEMNRWTMDTFDPTIPTGGDDLKDSPDSLGYMDASDQDRRYADGLVEDMWRQLGVIYAPLPPGHGADEWDDVNGTYGGNQIRMVRRTDGVRLPVRIKVKVDDTGRKTQEVSILPYDEANALIERWGGPSGNTGGQTPLLRGVWGFAGSFDVAYAHAPSPGDDLEGARNEYAMHVLPDWGDGKPAETRKAKQLYEMRWRQEVLAGGATGEPADQRLVNEQDARLRELDAHVSGRRGYIYGAGILLAVTSVIAGESVAGYLDDHIDVKVAAVGVKLAEYMAAGKFAATGLIRHLQSLRLPKFRDLAWQQAPDQLGEQLLDEQVLAEKYKQVVRVFRKKDRLMFWQAGK